MRLTRVFVKEPLAVNAEVTLAPGAAGHISRVLRLQSGNAVTLFDGRGGEYSATLLEVRGSMVRVRIVTHQTIERESPLHIVLAQAVARGERMDWVVQKATELGVASIAPLLTERCVVKLDAQQATKKAQHWRSIAIAACEQCGRNRVPEIAVPVPLQNWLEQEKTGYKLILHPTAAKSAAEVPATSAATLLIGPEGGLAEEERHQAQQTGFEPIRLGPRILRTETAGLTAIALLQARFGDLQ